MQTGSDILALKPSENISFRVIEIPSYLTNPNASPPTLAKPKVY